MDEELIKMVLKKKAKEETVYKAETERPLTALCTAKEELKEGNGANRRVKEKETVHRRQTRGLMN